MSTIIVEIREPDPQFEGTDIVVDKWAVTFPVTTELLDDPAAFGAYALEVVTRIREDHAV